MGIRIYKVMGYGINDLQTHEGYVTDPRFNLNSVPFRDWETDTEEPEDDLQDATGYLKYITSLHENRSPDDTITGLGYDYYTLSHAKKTRHSVLNSIVFDLEMGSSTTLCLVPVGEQKNWIRYDDPIDYEEEYIHANGKIADLEPRVRFIAKDNLYPYGEYVDIRTGEHVNGDKLRIIKYLIDDKIMMGEKLDSYINSELGIASYDEFKQYIVPRFPQDLINLITYTDLLTDMKYIYDFKPMIYTYWS